MIPDFCTIFDFFIARGNIINVFSKEAFVSLLDTCCVTHRGKTIASYDIDSLGNTESSMVFLTMYFPMLPQDLVHARCYTECKKNYVY